ncbi:uncharacterized protein LOC8276207 [Ricinus communis]|uniref:F-box domain-containing protein n=1 Tax=Ricinus communis TaxID=3988 RepID=B9STN6_RICCO|nr:uncharacterized protein LOC8276207 [Ricinus communis]EEF33022.1 conserved hypothetical protein [Ricinus communis]|eukprot:XP_002529355.1 uncharacterized protein LOC8276207 [Ricinus communis]
MENPRNSSSNAIGFCLLPCELIQHILLNLALPEIIGLKSLNKSISDIISDQVFVREYNSKSRSTNWLFVYKKRWHRDAVLHGFTDHSDRWFKLQIADLLKPIICTGDSVYFLAASGNFFLFSCNSLKEVIAVNLACKTVKKIPPSPLGPRGTSSWRRSGMKLVSRSNSFRFLFAELVETRPVLFVYASETDTWRSMEGKEHVDKLPRGSQRVGDYIYLNVVNGPYESVVMAIALESPDEPLVVRLRFGGERDDGERLTVGFSWGNVTDRLYVYGDGYMLVIKSNGVGDAETGARVLNDIELWGLGSSGRRWEYNSRIPSEIMETIKKPYRVIMGCLEHRDGVIRAALLSNFEGLWDIIWLCYNLQRCYWTWVPLPICKMKGLNMAGIAFSSGLTL